MRTLIFPALLAAAAPALAADGRPNYFAVYSIPEIFGVCAALTLGTWLAARRGVPGFRLKLAWNWILLVSFLVCALSGVALLAPMDRAVWKTLQCWHIWTGAVATWAGVYHTLQRLRALWPRRAAAAD